MSDKARRAGALAARFRDPGMRDTVLSELRLLYRDVDFGVTPLGGLSITLSDREMTLPRVLYFHAALILKPTDDPAILEASKNREGTQQLFRRPGADPPLPVKSTWDWVQAPGL